VMLEIDAHAHLAMLRDGIRAAKKKSDLDGGAPRPVVLVLPWAGGTRAPAAGVAAVARW